MGASDIYLKFYVGDYLADTGDLSTEEHGAYMLLLMNMWRSGGSLDSDAFRLRRMAKVETNERWSAIWSGLERFFTVLEDGRISQKRLSEEYRRAEAFTEAQSKRGLNSGRARANRGSTEVKPTLDRRSTSQSQSQSQSQGSGSETKSKPKAEKITPGKPADNLHARMLVAFSEAWERRNGRAYVPTPADKSQLGALLRSLKTEEAGQLPALFAVYVRSQGKLELERGHDLNFFCTQGGFNRYRAGPSTATGSKTGDAFAAILGRTGS